MPLPEPYYRDDDNGIVLYCGDCLTILPELEPGSVDAVVTDPPYGIGKRLVLGGAGHSFDSLVLSGADVWDKKPSRETLQLLLSFGTVQIIWGGNFFELPPCDMPLCWDKVRPNQKNLSDWEYAWTSLVGRARKFAYCANGGFVAKEDRQHPTQKPVAVMEWCLGFTPTSGTVADPYMGSGTTGVACLRTGRRFIGIEISEEYCEIAANRLRKERDRTILFDRVEKPRQRNLALA
jgi:DNA modification methylase